MLCHPCTSHVAPWMLPDAPVLANEAKLVAGQLSLSPALTDCINLGFNPAVESHPLFTFCSCSWPVLPEPGISSDSSCTARARIELQAHTHWQGHRRAKNLDMGIKFGKIYSLSGGQSHCFNFVLPSFFWLCTQTVTEGKKLSFFLSFVTFAGFW